MGNSKTEGVSVKGTSTQDTGLIVDGNLDSGGSKVEVSSTIDIKDSHQAINKNQDWLSQVDEYIGSAVERSGYQGISRPVSVEICTRGGRACQTLNVGQQILSAATP